jgi:hypothetical protein
MTTRSDIPKQRTLHIPKRTKKRFKQKKLKKNKPQKTITDKKYILSRIYADIDLNSYLTEICWSAIQRLYDDQFAAVKSAFLANPLNVINIICARLEAKQIEWEAERKSAREIYREVAISNSMKALDMQPKYKRLDKQRLSVSEVWREVIFAQSMLDPTYLHKIENERQKRFCLKEQQREQFHAEADPLNAASTIKPTQFGVSSGGCWYNYGLRFDLHSGAVFNSVINLPMSTHEHAWNCIVQYFCSESESIKAPVLRESIRFFCNFIFLLFGVQIFHKELLPSEAFDVFGSDCGIKNDDESKDYLIQFDALDKLTQIGVNCGDAKTQCFAPLVIDDEEIENSNAQSMHSYHNRKSILIFLNREAYNVLRLYLHLFARLQKARDFSTERWRLNFDASARKENEAKQEKNERLFYGKLMALIQGQVKEQEFDSIIAQLFGPQAFELTLD